MTDEECHCEPRFFALFLCHCELVVSSAKQSQPPDCFGPSALAMTSEKSHCEVVVLFPKQSQRLLRFARSDKEKESCGDRKGLAITPIVSLRGRRFALFFVTASFAFSPSEAVSFPVALGLLRRFAPRSDKGKVSLRGQSFVSEVVSEIPRRFAARKGQEKGGEAVSFPVVLRPLRRFAPRGDRRRGVTARS